MHTVNKILLRVAGLSLLICSCSVTAGTIIEIQNKGKLTTMLTDGKQARLNISDQEYVIIDYRNNKLKLVDQKRQQVTAVDVGKEGKSTANNSKLVNVSLNKLGAAQNVAGYRTQKFGYAANGKSCGVILASKDASQENGVSDLLAAMQTMINRELTALGGFTSFVDACTLADMQLTDKVASIGLPMRTVKNGAVETEVRSIRVGVKLAENTFSIPATYKNLTRNAPTKQVTKVLSNEKQQLKQQLQQPGMEQVRIQQVRMQQQGRLTPEMMERMRHNQRMMQQYQQPRR